MIIIQTATGNSHQVKITPVETTDYKFLTKKRYFFNWKEEQNFEVYKLSIVNSTDILGLISLERIPSEWRVHIRLLTVSFENQGRNKTFEHIAGNLLTFAAKIAISAYAEMACISLRPKTEIAKHYIEKYNMTATGLTLSIEMPEIIHLINRFDHDET